jgi:multiple sugar transport system substrate-binding protein
MRSIRWVRSVVVIVVLALVGAACGGDIAPDSDGGTAQETAGAAPGEPGGTETEQGAAADGEQVDLVFWTWVPNIENQVELFEEAHPNINVEVVNVGQGADHYQRLRTALEAGSGAPDVAQIEYQLIPSYTITDSLVDLSQYGADEVASDYVDWVWEQVSDDSGAVWAIPQDTGPMGLLYRQDIFEEHGIDVPTTWDEFAEAGRELREAAPGTYLTNLPPNDPGQIVGLFWQAGSQPFQVEGEQLSININDEAAVRVTEYWQQLIDDEIVSTDPDFVDEWYRGFTTDRYATWVTAAWGPVFLSGAVEETTGLWRAAPLPQWEEGGQASANWGGSTNAVTVQSQHPEEAAQLAIWINHEREPATMFALEQFFFPPQLEVLEDPKFRDFAFEFYGGQQVNQVFIESSEQVETGFQWSPFQSYVYDQLAETYGGQMKPGGDMVGALDRLQDTIVDYAESQGFTVQ